MIFVEGDSSRLAPLAYRHAIIPFDASEIEGSIAARFEKVVAACPDHIAVETATARWTYVELNRQANRVAAGLLDLAGPDPEPVALLMAHDAPLVAAILGVLKAGKFFSVLDPDHPETHLQFLLDDLQARWLIHDPDHAYLAQDLVSHRRTPVSIEELEESPTSADLGLAIPRTRPATIIYTSGSTGRPKGVIRTHSLTLYRAHLDHHQLGVGPNDRIPCLSRPVYAGPMSDTTVSLLNGATLLPFDARYHSVDVLAEWALASQLTLLRPPLGLLRQLLGALDEDQTLPALRLVDLGGDVLYRQDVLRLRRHVHPTCAFMHRYASSETGIVARMVIDPDRDLDSDIIPVGYPAPGREALIVDEQRRLVQPGQVGEIVVRGRVLASGYWRQPELTHERFVPDPSEPGVGLYFTGDLGRRLPDGRLVFIGRRDSQVKIRGYRVGLGMVESALLDLPGVSEAAVFAQPGPGDEKRLVAYVVLKDQSRPISDLRDALAKILPAHMLPSAFVTLDAMPLTANGKVNRRALPKPDGARPVLTTPFVAPRSPTEAQLARIWRDVLGVEGIGVHDRFMDLGGDSLLAGQVISRINRQFHTRLPVRDLFRAATPAEMAALLDAAAPDSQPDPLPRLVEEVEHLSDEDVERMLRDEDAR